MMRKLRKVKKMRGPMIVLVIMLSIGLVGSFMLSGSGVRSGQPIVDQNMNIEEQVKYLEGLLEKYNEEYQTKPDNEETVGMLAEIHWYLAGLSEEKDKQEEHLKASLGFYEKLLEKKPNNAEILTRIAIVSYQAGEEEKAEEYFNKSLEIDPNSINALANYGVFLMNTKGDFHGALTQFEKALEQDMPEQDKEQIGLFVTIAKQMIEALENNEQELPETGENTNQPAN